MSLLDPVGGPLGKSHGQSEWLQKCVDNSTSKSIPKTLYVTKTINFFQKLDIDFSIIKSEYLWLFSYLDCRNLKKYLCHFVPKVVSNFLYEEIGELTVFVIFSVFGIKGFAE